jgi:hypothetical protein
MARGRAILRPGTYGTYGKVQVRYLDQIEAKLRGAA